MIINLDIQIILEQIMQTNSLLFSKDNYIETMEMKVKSPAILAARIFDLFDLESNYIGLQGGVVGELIKQYIKKTDMNMEFVDIQGESRLDLIINDNQKKMYLKGKWPRITAEDINKFNKMILNLFGRGEIISINAEDYPQSIPNELFEEIGNYSRSSGYKLVITANANNLDAIAKGKPYILIIDKDEVEDYCKVKFDYDRQLIDSMTGFLDKGIEFVLLDLKGEGLVFMVKDKYFRIRPSNGNKLLKINESLAFIGVCVGMSKGFDAERTLKLAYAIAQVGALEMEYRKIQMVDVKECMKNLDFTTSIID